MQRIGRRTLTGVRLAGSLLALGIHGATALAGSEVLTITTEDLPPFNMQQDGKMAGISTDMLVAALDQAHVGYRISLYPWLRAYEMALKDTSTCVYSTTYTPERAPLFKWVGPLAKDNWVVFALAGNQTSIRSLDDLRGYHIGTGKGDALALFLKKEGFEVDEVVHPAAAANDLNIKKLESGRIDFWAAGRLTGSYAAAQLGFSNLKEVLSIKESALYLACNKSVSDEVVADLNAALRNLSAGGVQPGLAKSAGTP